MRTILEALIDEVHYPLSEGYALNRLMARGLCASEGISPSLIRSDAFRGVVADCLVSLVSAPSFSESDKSISLGDRRLILSQANAIYRSLGEVEVKIEPEARVTFID